MNQLARLPLPPEPPARGRRRRGARPGTFGVLDLGSTKVVCLIARLESDGEPRVLGFGWQRGRGVKAGNVIDLEEAERAIRAAVGPADWDERVFRLQVRRARSARPARRPAAGLRRRSRRSLRRSGWRRRVSV
jgi:hypothetical protein